MTEEPHKFNPLQNEGTPVIDLEDEQIESILRHYADLSKPKRIQTEFYLKELDRRDNLEESRKQTEEIRRQTKNLKQSKKFLF